MLPMLRKLTKNVNTDKFAFVKLTKLFIPRMLLVLR